MERIRDLILKRMVLRTASVWVQGPGGKARLRILFDSGYQRTLVKWSSIKSIGLRPEMGENIHIFGLGGTIDGMFRHKGFCLPLLPGDGRDAIPVFLYALAVDEIGVPIPSATKGVWVDELRRRNLPLAKDPEISENTLDVLVGADQYLSIVDEKDTFYLRNGLQASNTALGWVLFGPQDGTEQSPPQPIGASFPVLGDPLVVLHLDDRLDASLKEQWDIASLRILPNESFPLPVEQHPVYTNFQATIRLQNGRYTVLLP